MAGNAHSRSNHNLTLTLTVRTDREENLTNLVECDETALGKRKYQRGKRQRSTGTQWVQTMVEVEENMGKRTPKRLRAMLVDDRATGTLVGVLKRKGRQLNLAASSR
jgi:hypothetical protein